MLNGKLYDEPQYTNIFASYKQLIYLLRKENDSISKQLENDLNFIVANQTLSSIQIDLPDYINNSLEWRLTTMWELEIEENNEIPFVCYKFHCS